MWVFFAPFIATLKISTAISVLLLLLILTPPPLWYNNNLCKDQHFKNILKRFFLSVTKILSLYRFPFYITISFSYKISSYIGGENYQKFKLRWVLRKRFIIWRMWKQVRQSLLNIKYGPIIICIFIVLVNFLQECI